MTARKPVDFNELLRALGAADAEPPPLMKKLLGERPDGLIGSNSSVNEAIIAELEAWLAAIQLEKPGRD